MRFEKKLKAFLNAVDSGLSSRNRALEFNVI